MVYFLSGIMLHYFLRIESIHQMPITVPAIIIRLVFIDTSSCNISQRP